MNNIILFISSIFAGNIVLTEFLGISSVLGTDKEKGAFEIGLLIGIMSFISSTITYLLYHFILNPLGLEYLRIILVVLILIAVLPLIELIIKKYFSFLNDIFGKHFPILIANCTVVGISLLVIERGYNFISSILFSLGSSIGFILIMYIFSTISERLSIAPIVKPLKGFPIVLITISIMAMVFSRYIAG